MIALKEKSLKMHDILIWPSRFRYFKNGQKLNEDLYDLDLDLDEDYAKQVLLPQNCDQVIKTFTIKVS